MTDRVEPAVPPPGPARPVLSRRPLSRLSIVWLVPVLALLIGIWLLVRALTQIGPRIEIQFGTAEGLEPGKTEVRYKEVVIGRVRSVRLREDRQGVVAVVQLDESAASVATDDSRFWVVRPRIGTGGVSGLATLLSGAYIGVDTGSSKVARRDFVGLEAPPYVLRGEPGASFVLRAADLGSLDVGSPVYYRRARVGRVVGYDLDLKRDDLSVKIFVEAPYQQLVTPQARFWNASGVDLTLNANGLTVDSQTIASVLAGGIAFEQAPSVGPLSQASDGREFTLFGDRKSALAPVDGMPVTVSMVFDQSARGLSPGAPVDLLGVEIGNVRSVTLQFDAKRQRFPVQVIANIFPLRLGAVREALIAATHDGAATDTVTLQGLVDRGLRAQLRTGNLLTGQLYVGLDFVPQAPKQVVELRDGVLTLPSVPGTLAEVQPQIAQIVDRFNKIPFDEIGRELHSTLKAANRALAELTPEAKQALATANSAMMQLTPQAKEALAGVQQTLQSAQATLDRLERGVLDANAPIQRRAQQALAEVQRAANALRELADYLQRHPESLLRGSPADPPLPLAPAQRGSP